MSKKVLVTGFDPFGGESINAAWEAVRHLADKIGDCVLHKMQIPTIFGEAAQEVLSRAYYAHPDVIICVGQAAGRAAITPERLALNLRDASIGDNRGDLYEECPCVYGGPDIYYSTVPFKAMSAAIREAGLPSYVSLSAGSFVCNDTLYSLLHHYQDKDVKVGFIHVPLLHGQAKDGQPSMSLEEIVRGLTAAIKVLGQ